MSVHGMKIYLFIVAITLAAISISSFILLIYSLMKYNRAVNKSKKAPKIKSKQYPTLASSLFECCSCFTFIGVVFEIDPHSSNNFEENETFVILMIVFAVFIFLAKLSLYAQFLVRLYFTFKSSALSINKRTIIASLGLFFLTLIMIIWWIILVIMKNVSKGNIDSYYAQLLTILLCLIISDLCLSYMVVILFIRKLFRFLLFKDRTGIIRRGDELIKDDIQNLVDDESHDNMDHMDDIEVDNENDQDNDNESERSRNLPNMQTLNKTYSFVLDIVAAGIDDSDMKTLDLITRQLVLSTLSIIITQFVYLTLIFVISFRSYFEKHSFGLYWVFGGVAYPMDVIINSIVLYFNYKFGMKYYMCCCKLCHAKCKLCAIRHAAKKIYKQHYQGLSLRDTN